MNAFHGGPPARPFQTTISSLRSQFAGLALDDEDRAVSICNKAVGCLEHFGDETERLVASRTQALEVTFGLFTEALQRIARGTCEEAVEAAAGLERVTRDLSSPDSLRRALDAICEATERHERLRNEIERDLTLSKGMQNRTEGDPATGLPEAHEAIQVISSLIEGARAGHILAFIVEHFDSINTRFGLTVGERVLQTFAQHLAQRMHAREKLFRWHGACFVAITDEGLPDSMLAAEAARIATTKMEYANTVGPRDFVLPITCAWTMLPVPPGAPLAGVVRTLDEFASGKLAGHHSGRPLVRR